jgi:hypothetical protein
VSSKDPLVIFLAGGATGILGTIVAEVAASRRQARQFRQELALKEVDRAADHLYDMFHILVRLRVKLKGTQPKDRTGDSGAEIQALFTDGGSKMVELGALDLKLSLRFGDSELVDRYSSVLNEFDQMLDELHDVFKEKRALPEPPSFEPLSRVMSEFAERARALTGGL